MPLDRLLQTLSDEIAGMRDAGTLKGDEDVTRAVVAARDGRVEQVHVEQGAQVEQGSLIAQLGEGKADNGETQ